LIAAVHPENTFYNLFKNAIDSFLMRTRKAFTLLELLVVVAIIALLAGILLPSLARVRYVVRLSVCSSNLHQLGLAVATYSNSCKTIPHGPDVQPLPPSLEANDGTLATNQVWTGPQEPTSQTMSLGLLLNREMKNPELLYCPGDDSTDPEEELAKIKENSPAPVFGSFLYRQLQETDGPGRLNQLGKNSEDRQVRALAMDMNALFTFDAAMYRTNHKGKKINILYNDLSVKTELNGKQQYSLRDQDIFDLEGRRAEILRTADTTY
jgi:prepilin-type N-terminal cleavage/methylation domain-containing protein